MVWCKMQHREHQNGFIVGLAVVTFLTPLASNSEYWLIKRIERPRFHGTENQNQVSFCPFALRQVSVLTELILGHLR